MTINVNADGTINLVEGSTDIGGTRASIAMQAAEVLGIPAESVNPSVVDTNSVGYTAVTGVAAQPMQPATPLMKPHKMSSKR